MSEQHPATKLTVVEAPLIDSPSSGEKNEVPAQKRKYEKPELVTHGTVGELTQSGGNRQHDGVFTRKLS